MILKIKVKDIFLAPLAEVFFFTFKRNYYRDAFEKYLKESKENGVRREARYMLFLLRKLFGLFGGTCDHVYKFLERKFPKFVNEQYWGKTGEESKEVYENFDFEGRRDFA